MEKPFQHITVSNVGCTSTVNETTKRFKDVMNSNIPYLLDIVKQMKAIIVCKDAKLKMYREHFELQEQVEQAKANAMKKYM